jgi:hypothetical protein
MAEFTKKIKITANTAEAEAALAKLEVRFKEFGEAVEHFQQPFQNVSNAAGEFRDKLERIGLASVFAEGGILGLTNKIADMGYELGETSIKTGLTTAQLQYWQYAAKQSGVDAEELTNAFRFMNVAMGEARNVTSLQSQAFRFLGISLKDANGHAKDTNEAFIEVMKKLGGMHDVAMKNRIAMILFSRSYLDLLPLMKSVSEGSKENAEDFKKYGMVLSEDAIKQSDEFHRASINLQTSLGSLADSIGMILIPALRPMITNMADYVSQNRQALSNDITSMILSTAHGFSEAYTTLKPFLSAFSELVSKMGGAKTVILTIAGYIAGDLLLSFVALTAKITLATIQILRFGGTAVITAIEAVISPVKTLTKAWEALNAAMAVNPLTIIFSGIASAIGLIIYAAYKLYHILKQIKDTFDLHELLRELGALGKMAGGKIFSAMVPDFKGALPSQTNPFPRLATAAPQQAVLPIFRNAGNANTNNNLNIHMKIDSDGRPSIQDVQSSSPISFTSQLGFLR